MGTFVPTRMTPDGRRMTIPNYNEYMQNVYNPQQNFAGSVNARIPGVNAPVGTGGNIPGFVGMAPPQPSIPSPQQPQSSFQSVGPYGQQAMQMAGLLGHRPTPQQPTSGIQGLLGGPPKGFRIPRGK